MIRLAVFRPQWERSVRIYVDNILRRLSSEVEVEEFGPRDSIPTRTDVYWDPGASGARAPYPAFWRLRKPSVFTIHGAAPLALAPREFYPNWRKALTGRFRHGIRRLKWHRFDARYAEFITVSNFAKAEIEQHLGLAAQRITPIHHGVDHALFSPNGVTTSPEPTYFLHVGSHQPVKNLERVVQAYQTARLPAGVGLTVVCPGREDSRQLGIPGIRWIHSPLDPAALSSLYRGALALLFPSLRESFGLPIVEAMASGCPVLTSHGSGCEEIAGDAAVLVDPRSVAEIRDEMTRLAIDSHIRADLSRRGLQRAQQFSWRRAARAHANVFWKAAERHSFDRTSCRSSSSEIRSGADSASQ